jgi:nucleoside-diphosphate-sugar epimerase
MKIFLTGATGFIGSHFVSKALSEGHNLTCLRRPGSRTRIKLKNEPTWIEGTLEDDWRNELSDCDALVHLAAVGVRPQKATRLELLKINVLATYNLLLSAIDVGIKKYLISGSFAEYGQSGSKFDFIPTNAMLEPTTSYAASKAAFLQLLYALTFEEELQVIYARIFSAFGKGQYKGNLWPSMHKAALEGSDFHLTAGKQERDFILVENVAELLVSALSFSNVIHGNLDVRNIGSGNSQTIREFAEYWWSEWGATGKLHFGSKPYRKNEVMRCIPLIEDSK